MYNNFVFGRDVYVSRIAVNCSVSTKYNYYLLNFVIH